MEGLVFIVEYTDRQSGNRVKQEVVGHEVARQLAKSLAIASGRRAVVSRKPLISRRWSVHVADCETGEIYLAWKGLTKAEVLRRWKVWKEGKTRCVLVAWPEWLPELSMQLPSVAA